MARTRKKGNPIVSAVVFGIFGIVLLFLGIRTFIGLHGKLLNVTTCDESEVKPGVYSVCGGNTHLRIRSLH